MQGVGCPDVRWRVLWVKACDALQGAEVRHAVDGVCVSVQEGLQSIVMWAGQAKQARLARPGTGTQCIVFVIWIQRCVCGTPEQ